MIRWRRAVLAAWLAGGVGLALLVPKPDPRAHELTSFLPADTPYSRAVQAMREAFPGRSGLSEAVVIFERPDGPLQEGDFVHVARVAARIGEPGRVATREDLAGISVRGPGSIPLPDNPLISQASERGQAALIVVNIPANFITLRSDRVVDHVYSVLADPAPPGGLKVAVTGSSGFGHDYADAAERSHRRTLYVTLAIVIAILLLVYRAPAAVLIPLAAISAAAFVALKLLAIAQHFGLHFGTAERIFVVVLLYGAGTDYSLFFISRFREFLSEEESGPVAAAKALDATLPAVLTSAGTDTAGLLMLCFARYGVFRTTGVAVAVALLVALLAATTLVPALVAMSGRLLFWPTRTATGSVARLPGLGQRKFWPALARAVTTRPATVFVIAVLVLAIPAVRGARLTWVYDTLTELRRNADQPIGNSAVGIDMASRHWPVGEVGPARILIRASEPLAPPAWRRVVDDVTQSLAETDGVHTVRSLSRPLGRQTASAAEALLAAAGARQIREEYLSADGGATRLIVVLDSPAFSLRAMETLGHIRRVVHEAMKRLGVGAEVHLAGPTAEMIDIRNVTRRDFYLVAGLCLGVVLILVVVLLRDVLLSLFMVGSTVLGYFATLGIAYWVFVGLGGRQGLDWKVEVFLFVVMVAVGQDYNIFLAFRLAQEARRLPVKLAIRRSVIRTGPVISSCGLIMAGTLGSLMTGDLELLRQLGFALALGMLIDTFLVRPLLLPAFVAMTGRTGHGIGLSH